MKGLQKFLNEPKRLRLLKYAFILAAILTAFFEAFVVNILHLGHGYFWFDVLPAFGSLFGFVSSVIIIIAAKFILYPLISRKEEHYD